MSTQELRDLLGHVEDTRELVLRPRPDPAGDDLLLGELFAVWAVAHADSNAAYETWRIAPGADAYAVYVAARDRADAAQDALADV